MKRIHALASTAALLLLLAVGAGPATASDSLGSQTAGQFAGSGQNAVSHADSTQVNPTNKNISVRVLSPGNNGSVTQSNDSKAISGAINDNATSQALTQGQGGSGGGTALQEASQLAGNLQSAHSHAESKQIHPTNTNISVRVLSEGNDGDVRQTNDSKAKSFAGNWNQTTQDQTQHQSGSRGAPCCVRQNGGLEERPNGVLKEQPNREARVCCPSGGGTGIQAGGQKVLNLQNAESGAKSVQYMPTNKNIGVRVLSGGHDGNVDQSNNSAAKSGTGNGNSTTQTLDQTQAGSGLLRLCCYGDEIGIQAAGQKVLNLQNAVSHAKSKQIHPENENKSLRFKSPDFGTRPVPVLIPVLVPSPGGTVSQSNNSFAGSFAGNWNTTHQTGHQFQGAGLMARI